MTLNAVHLFHKHLQVPILYYKQFHYHVYSTQTADTSDAVHAD